MQSLITIDLRIFLWEELSNMPTLLHGGKLAAALINSIPDGVEMVFGPVKSGGVMHNGHPYFRGNLCVIEKTIPLVQAGTERTVLDYILFKPFIDEHRLIWLEKHKRSPGTFHEPLINDFFALMFATKKIEVGHFVHGWGHDRLAKFAHRTLEKQKKTIVDLPKGFHEQRQQAAA
jgi:hypothetical protein